MICSDKMEPKASMENWPFCERQANAVVEDIFHVLALTSPFSAGI